MLLTDKIRATLVKMADNFDQQGKFELAEKVDSMLTSKAARHKTPLKNMNDDLKKSLIVFLLDADNGMKSGVSGLNELFRRMRYFDISDSIKDLGLDRVVKDMQKTQECLDGAKKDFYTMTFGKRPSKSDFDKLLEELGNKKSEEDDGQEALDFFNQQKEDEADSDEPYSPPYSDELEPESDKSSEDHWLAEPQHEDEPKYLSEEELEDEDLKGFWDDNEATFEDEKNDDNKEEEKDEER